MRTKSASTRASNGSLLAPLCRNRSRASRTSWLAHARSGMPQAFSEFVATFGLLAVIWGCAGISREVNDTDPHLESLILVVCCPRQENTPGGYMSPAPVPPISPFFYGYTQTRIARARGPLTRIPHWTYSRRRGTWKMAGLRRHPEPSTTPALIAKLHQRADWTIGLNGDRE